MNDASRSVNRAALGVLAILLLSTSLACSLGQMLVGEPTPTPTLVPAIIPPTWTPSPVGQLSPGQIATLTVIAGISFPTLTPTPTEIVTPTPTPTFAPPTPPPDTPTPVPTPYVVVVAPQVNLRSGPSVAYPVIGQAVKDQTFAITGRNDAFTWWQVCCIDGQQAWITTQLTAPGGPADTVPIVAPPELPQLPPTPFPTNTPVPEAPTPVPAPVYPFWLAEGPELWETNNAWLTIWLKAFYGKPPIYLASEGYRLKVLRNGVDVSNQALTADRFQVNNPIIPDDPKAYGNRKEYNLKYEYFPEAGDATWTISLTDPNGVQVSPEVSFETKSGEKRHEVYVSFNNASQ
jgi:hypothetical protein